ncbi:unnamed protein product, partial [Rotaria socialis]
IEWLKINIDSSPFVSNQQVSSLIDEVETVVTDHLENGNRKKAMQKLRVPPLVHIHKRIVTYRLGLFNGLFTILLINLYVIYIFTSNSYETTKNRKPIDWQIGIILYRSTLIFIIHMILIGINIIGWSSYGINHVLIFELDPRSHVTHEEILEGASLLSLIWIISFISFILCEYHQLESHWQPVIFISIITFLLFNPLNIMHRSARYWFCKELFRIFAAPFHRVTFADFWLADQLTSLDLIFYDIEYLICYFAFDAQWTSNQSNRPYLNLTDEQTILYNAPICHGKYSPFRTSYCSPLQLIFFSVAPINTVFQTIIGALPSWFRVAQCLRRYYDTRLGFPHLVNACKYSLGVLVAIFSGLQRQFASKYTNEASNPFFYAWILSQILNSSLKFAWDLKMDWGFFDQRAGENWFLRDELVYPQRLYYYLIIIINFFLRYSWIIRVYLHIQTQSFEHLQLIVFIFALLESFRRFIWNFFRLENEHLNNCGQFRAVRDISVNPRQSLLPTTESEHLLNEHAS